MKPLYDHIQQYGQLKATTQRSLGAVLQKVTLEKGTFLITEGKMCNHL
jgi:hypothetical protein